MIIMIYCMLPFTQLPDGFHKIYNWFAIVCTLIIFFFPARKTMSNAFKSMKNATPSMDVLIAIGSIAAFVTAFLPGMYGKHSFIEIASMIVAIHLTGRYIEAKTKGKTSEAIRKLMELGAKSASILCNGEIKEIPISELKLKDIMVIKPGAKIPTDGIIIEGESYIDESMATGESMPIRKRINDFVFGATINGNSSLKVQVTKIGKDTFLSCGTCPKHKSPHTSFC
jgi:Cu+-exporting ATPase